MTTQNAINAPLPISVANGGTGSGTASGARSNLSAAINGANNDITSMTALTGYFQAPIGVKDSNGNIVNTFVGVGSSVNYLVFTNAISGTTPSVSATGSDSSVPLGLNGKGGEVIIADSAATVGGSIALSNAALNHQLGFKTPASFSTTILWQLPTADGATGTLLSTNGSAVLSYVTGAQIPGTATNDSASAGNIGEFLSSVITSGSPTTMTANAATNLTSIVLSAGDWDVWGNIHYLTAGTSPTQLLAWISSTSATTPDASLSNNLSVSANLAANAGLSAPMLRFSVSTNTTVYISGYIANTNTNGTACGGIYARRRR